MIELITGVVITLLGAIGVLYKQRNNARNEAERLARQENMHRKAIEQKVRVEQSRAEVRKQNEARQHEATERPTGNRPTGNLPR